MSVYDEINRKPSRKDLLYFGAVFLAGASAIGAVERFVAHRDALAMGLWIAGALVFALSFVPPIGRLLYIAWMGLGITLGLVTTPIILVAVFALLVTPVALIFKLMGRDAMKRRIDRSAQTYWEPYPEHTDAATYLRQY